MNIDYVPVTIGADDGTHYELIFATLADFKSTWGTMDQNYVIHFSDPLEWVHATDPQLAPFNTDPVYYVKTEVIQQSLKNLGAVVASFYRRLRRRR